MRAENRTLLGPHDVVLATHPGSGASWIGTLLVHLGVFYVSGHNELLVDRESQRTTGEWVEDEELRFPGLATTGSRDQQQHLPVLEARDHLHASYREPCRVIKTNRSAVGWTPPTRVVLLVRDGRDAVLSLYHNLRSFGGLDVPLPEFLRGRDSAWPPPAMSWGFACLSWLGSIASERLHVVKFEACRERPLEEFRALLGFLGTPRTDAEIEHAMTESSYERMRRVESAEIERRGDSIGRGRVMRKGQVGEWREVYTEEMLRTFTGLPRRALAGFGYPTDTVPHSGSEGCCG